MSNKIEATIITEGDERNIVPEDIKIQIMNIPVEGKINLAKFNLKMEYGAIINPLIKKTNMNCFTVTNQIIDSIDFKSLVEMDEIQAAKFLGTILFTELFRLGMEATNFSTKDYSIYVSEQKTILTGLAHKTYSLIK